MATILMIGRQDCDAFSKTLCMIIDKTLCLCIAYYAIDIAIYINV